MFVSTSILDQLLRLLWTSRVTSLGRGARQPQAWLTIATVRLPSPSAFLPADTPAVRCFRLSCRRMRRSLDHFSQAAISAGYGSRAVYKLQELNSRHRLLRPNDTVVDLGAVRTAQRTPAPCLHVCLPSLLCWRLTCVLCRVVLC